MVQTAIEWSQEAVARCVATVVKSRRAVRAFRPEPLRRELIQEILAEAATAPSGANIQPWRVYVVSGAVKDELANVLVAASARISCMSSRRSGSGLKARTARRDFTTVATHRATASWDHSIAVCTMGYSCGTSW